MSTRILLGLLPILTIASVATVTAQSERAERAAFGRIDGQIGTSSVVRHEKREGVERGFIPVSIPEMGDTLIIDLAELVVTVSTVYDSTAPLLIAALPSTVSHASRASSWQEDWTEMTGGFDPEFLAVTSMNSTEREVELRIDVTEVVRRWSQGELPNHGLVLTSLTEDKHTFTWTRDGRYNGADAKLEILYSRNPLSAR